VQGLLDVISVKSISSSETVASKPTSASLIPFRHAAQEANLIDRLRQKAGPAAIDYAVPTMIEEAYAPAVFPEEYRQANINDHMVPVDYQVHSERMSKFVKQCIDVIKHDLGKLGYTISSTRESYASRRTYESVVLMAYSSGNTGTALENVVAESSYGPALRVSNYS